MNEKPREAVGHELLAIKRDVAATITGDDASTIPDRNARGRWLKPNEPSRHRVVTEKLCEPFVGQICHLAVS